LGVSAAPCNPQGTAMQAVQGFVRDKPLTSALYGVFGIGCAVIYRTLQAKASGSYDFVLTLSAGFQTLAFALLVFASGSQVGEGLSEKTLWAFFIAHVTRLSTTFWGEGYIPEDNTSDIYLYQILELTGVIMLSFKLLTISTARAVHDVGQGLERWSTLVGMVAISCVLAWFTKSTGHDDYFADLSWMFSVWLEAFALIPQVRLLAQTPGIVDTDAMHFAVATLLGSLAFAAFWAKTSSDKFDEFHKAGVERFMYGILAASGCRVLLCGCYAYLFMSSGKRLKSFFGGGKAEYEPVALDDEEL